jgi:FAS-associated factor 2
VERVLDNDFGTTRQSIQPSLFSFLTKPIVWGFKFLWNIINFIFELFPKRIRYQTISKPFHEKFKELYGEKGPVFLQGSYSQALEKAKQDLLFLLVILHSEDHDDTHQFCIETLVSEPFVNYINEKNILVWGGNVKESEAYKVSTMLGATKYPFMAFIALHENRMKVVHRFEGMIPATSLVDTMDRLIERLNRPYEVARQERASREAARSIREQQDAAYQESLRLDREKADRLRLEQQEQMEKEQQEQDLAKDVERKKLVFLVKTEKARIQETIGIESRT